MSRLFGYLRLLRLANIVTAVSDILAGIVIANAIDNIDDIRAIFFLVLSTMCLYGGGVVLNDVFDAELDKAERPERPIPSGLISKSSAAIFGTVLLLAGIIAAWLSQDNFLSPAIAAAIALAAVVYDKWGKHNAFLGPINMGLCRALNLLLGMSIADYAVWALWPLAIVPMIYIAAITMISRGEVHGGKKITLYIAALLYMLVIIIIGYFAYADAHFFTTIIFLLIFGLLIFPPLQKAIQNPEGPRIGKAVKSGVIALIAMNASWAAALGNIYFAVFILLLLPLSLWLAGRFAVT